MQQSSKVTTSNENHKGEGGGEQLGKILADLVKTGAESPHLPCLFLPFW